MGASNDGVQTGNTRVFMLPGRAGPAAVPEYEGLAAADTTSWKQGDTKLVRIPSPNQLNKFITVGKVAGDPGMPQMKVQFKYTYEASEALALIESGCAVDLQVHIGLCQDPRMFNAPGWNKILVVEDALITDYALGRLGALNPSERAEVLEDIPFDGTDMYEIMPMVYAEQAGTQVVREIVDIIVADLVSCGGCATTSDGCQVLFAVSVATTGSPGLPADVLYSINGGATWSKINDVAIPANIDPTSLQVVGTNLVIVGPGTAGAGYVTYATVASVLAGTASFTNVATGIVASNEPNIIYSQGPALTWIGGKAGYIYFTSDPTSGLTVQDAAVATTQQINCIHGVDQLNLIACGASNAIIFTNNGGDTWAALTGPNAGVALNTCFMYTNLQWFVGDAAGKLWYTTNAGVSWTQIPLPNQSTLTSIRDIQFGFQGVHQTVGYLVANTATVGYLFRSVGGGAAATWYPAPELNGVLPTNARLDSLATCYQQNVVFAAGLKTAASDGIIVKGA